MVQQTFSRVLGAVELLRFHSIICRFALLEGGDVGLSEADLGR